MLQISWVDVGTAGVSTCLMAALGWLFKKFAKLMDSVITKDDLAEAFRINNEKIDKRHESNERRLDKIEDKLSWVERLFKGGRNYDL